MQQLLRSIYNNRWFPFQSIPLSSSPKPSPSSLSPSGSSAPLIRTVEASLAPADQDHQCLLEAPDPRTRAHQFHLLQTTSTSLSVSVSLASPYLPNQPIHPIISLNAHPWHQFLLLDQSQPPNSRPQTSPPAHSSSASLTILIYGLEPGTVYDVDVELTLPDHHTSPHSASSSSLGSHDQLDDDDRHDAMNDQPLARRHLIAHPMLSRGCPNPDLKLADTSARTTTQIAHIDPDGPPPPYTSYDPASPTQTCTSDVAGSPSHSFSFLESSFASIPSPETSVDTSGVPVPSSGNPNKEEEQALRAELEKQALALSAAIDENAPLKQSLHDLEQLIKRLDEENAANSAELLAYDESQRALIETKIEGQKEELKRKAEECKALEQTNRQKLDALKQNNQALKTRWEDTVQQVGEFREKTLKPIEEEIEELTRQLSESEKEIKSLDRESYRRTVEHANQFQVVRPRTYQQVPPASTSRGSAIESATDQASRNHRKSKWRSMDDFKFINPSFGQRTHSTKRVTLDETGVHPKPSGPKTPTGGPAQQLTRQNQPPLAGLRKSVCTAAAGSPSRLPLAKKTGHLRGQSACTHALSAAPASVVVAGPGTMAAPRSSSVAGSSSGAKTWAEKLAQS